MNRFRCYNIFAFVVLFLAIFEETWGLSSKNESAICRAKNKNNVVWTCKKTNECQFAPEFKNLESQQQTVCGKSQICCPRKADSYDIAKQKCREHAANRWNFGVLNDKSGHNFKVEVCKIQGELSTDAEPVSAGEIPHMVLLGTGDQKPNWFCAGTLVSNQYVLTAAHCNGDAGFFGQALKPVYALVGTLEKPADLKSTNSSNLVRIVERINHPEYKSPKLDNDIALLKLEHPVEFSAFVQPVCLIRPVDTPLKKLSKKAALSGWGRPTPDDSTKPDVMVKTKIDLQDNSTCQKYYKNHAKFTNGFNENTMICAGDLIFSRTKCQTDTGGPLSKSIYEDGGYGCVWLQEGVISFGPNCGIKEPAVYTRVTSFLSWIQPIIWPVENDETIE